MCVNVTVDTSQIDKDKWDVSCQRSPARVFSTQPTRPSAIKPPLLVAKDRKSLKVHPVIADLQRITRRRHQRVPAMRQGRDQVQICVRSSVCVRRSSGTSLKRREEKA